jgi:hypothetical protein
VLTFTFKIQELNCRGEKRNNFGWFSGWDFGMPSEVRLGAVRVLCGVYMYIVYYGWKESEMNESMRIVGG